MPRRKRPPPLPHLQSAEGNADAGDQMDVVEVGDEVEKAGAVRRRDRHQSS